MTENVACEVRLDPEQRAWVERLIASGAYASADEVLRAGLAALQERDAGQEAWLREAVAPAYDALRADPARAVPVAEAFARVRDGLRAGG
jgi:antitoxin ParD1/3/4